MEETKLTVAQLKAELKNRGLTTNGNKSMLIERLRIANQPAEPTRHSPEIQSPKRRRIGEQESQDGSIVDENTAEETVPNEPTTDETVANTRAEQLSEWEYSLAQREDIVRRKEARLARYSLANNEPPMHPQPDTSTNPLPLQELTPRTIGLRDIIDILPEFDPDNRSTVDARQFVERVTRFKNAYGWSDGLLVLAVQAKLRGNAKTWADTQRKIHQRWDDFAIDLMDNFPNHRHEADVHIELANTRRNADEPLGRFYHRMCSVARRAGISEAATVKYIRNGLNHIGLRNVIAGMKFETCLELYAFLYRFEENTPNRIENTRVSYPRPATNSM